MKKIVAFVSLLILAVACTAPPPNTNVVSETNRNANATAPAAMTMTEADAIAKEKAIWESIKTKDYEAFGNMLANDQIEVLDVAVHDKAATIAGVKDFEPSEVTFSDWKYVPIDKDAYIIVYTANVKGKFQGKEFAPQTARGSSAWVARDGKWLAIFHQECPVRPPMTPAPTPATAAKPAASPSVAPVAATPGADAVANERLVWDLIKSKNYEAFGNVLAADFIEIEPDNFYDKAGSINGIKMFDATRWVVSDFKTVNIDADATVVTYVAKEPKLAPAGERHSTIWANRNGKWQAVLHHGGTPVVNMPASKATASPTAKY